MFKNYLVTAFRAMMRHKTASAISIFGLALGMSSALLIFLYIQFELTFDGFHNKKNITYRVLVKGKLKNEESTVEYRSSIVHGLAPALLPHIYGAMGTADHPPGETAGIAVSGSPPENEPTAGKYPWNILNVFRTGGLKDVTNAVRLSPQNGCVSYRDRIFEEDNFYFADPSVFSVFSFPLKSGDPETALSAPGSVVLTREMAEKYFGSEDPMGKKITFSLSCSTPISFTVTGVMRPIPENSTLRIHFLASGSFEALKKMLPEWQPLYTYTFITFGDIMGLLKDFSLWRQPAHVFSIADDFNKHLSKVKMKDFYADRYYESWQFTTAPFKDFHFDNAAVFGHETGRKEDSARKGSLLPVFLLFLLGALILMVSCINVMNLSTARSAARAKEIGMRKVMGASRDQLVFQFLTEAVVLSLVSLILALAMAEIFLPFFNMMVKRELVINYGENWGYYAAIAGMPIFAGMASGAYPAFFLSSFQPVDTFEGENLPASKTLRKGLMTFQLAVSVCILVFALLVIGELHFLRDKPLGFDKEGILIFKLDNPEMNERYPGLKKELLALPAVSGVTASPLAAWRYGTAGWSVFSFPESRSVTRMRIMPTDADYLRTYKIPVVEGADFPVDAGASDTAVCIINEAARKAIGSEFAAGKKLIHLDNKIFTVLGVAGDFHFFYPDQKIEPLAIIPREQYDGIQPPFVSVRLNPDEAARTVAKIRKTVLRHFPDLIFQYTFLDDELERLHGEKRDHWGIVLGFATTVSVFLACLGLIGFAEFESERKTVEIGIRKALGATRMEIALHFIKDFLRIALIANAIAWPVTYLFIRIIFYAIGYPYPFHTEFSVFLLAGMISIALTVITISFQTFKTASVNPADALRDE